jgi:hypothetical protein
MKAAFHRALAINPHVGRIAGQAAGSRAGSSRLDQVIERGTIAAMAVFQSTFRKGQ